MPLFTHKNRDASQNRGKDPKRESSALSLQAQLKLADHLRKMAEQGKDLDGMDVDLDELRAKLEKFKKGPMGKFFD